MTADFLNQFTRQNSQDFQDDPSQTELMGLVKIGQILFTPSTSKKRRISYAI
jgi:hypothetical protein